ncbi:expressed unknown protein [Seminavis robusta]|uniref:Uncharacterized protein n=1 Tax=Seminavis robusta TaxID=568900 RepID=A0A9N8DHZ7_9STRA|nr:expressed unknown protein [Seminavis robusta]|eukprot:Sro154_g069880.1 n/a (481) ;mRNA; f:17194-18724
MNRFGFLTFTILVAFAGAREFKDDHGIVFSWDDDKPPTVVANAFGAIPFYHFGMTNEQLVGVWGKWLVRGSNIDFETDDELSSNFASDPNQAELDFLDSLTDITPECSTDPNGCQRQFDRDTFSGLDPDFAVYVHFGPFAEVLSPIESVTGSPPIFIDTRFEDGDGCRTDTYELNVTNCYARSVEDVIDRIRELAKFLGVEESPEVVEDQQRYCEAANEFSLMAEQLQERGVRCLAASVRQANGGTINVFNTNNLPWLRTFEDLGLPLLTAPFESKSDFTYTYSVSDWYPECGGQPSGCETLTPALPTDCFLFDTRTFAYIEDSKEQVLGFLPEKTIEQDQYSYFHFNEGGFSYRRAAAVLNQINEDLKDVQPLYSQTPCATVDVSSREYTSLASGGLSAGQYACYNSELMTCPKGFEPGTSLAADIATETSQSSNGGGSSSNGNGYQPIQSSGALQLKRQTVVGFVTFLTGLFLGSMFS